MVKCICIYVCIKLCLIYHLGVAFWNLFVFQFVFTQTGIDVNVKNREGETALDIVTKFTKSGASSEIKHLLRGTCK